MTKQALLVVNYLLLVTCCVILVRLLPLAMSICAVFSLSVDRLWPKGHMQPFKPCNLVH